MIEIKVDAELAWRELRDRLDQSGRWPMLALIEPSNQGNWDAQVRASDLFSRFYFSEEIREGRAGDTPQVIVAAAGAIDGASAVSELPEDDSLTPEEYVSICQDDAQARFGKAPDIPDPAEFLAQHGLKTRKKIERWFLDWELTHCERPLELGQFGLEYLQWYEPSRESTALVLLPTLNGWEALAYLNWFASEGRNSQLLVALLRDWNSRYGAELVANYGTMLQLIASQPPQSIDDAFELAWQQYAVAPCTTVLPGVSPRDHARALLKTDRWFLHERP